MTPVIAALEAATEGSRALDAEVYCALCECSRSHWVEDNAPEFTTDLEAITEWMPAGWFLDLEQRPAGLAEASGQWEATLIERCKDCAYSTSRVVEGRAPTPALALCIAALRARAAG